MRRVSQRAQKKDAAAPHRKRQGSSQLEREEDTEDCRPRLDNKKLLGSQAVAIGEQEDRIVTFGVNGIEQAVHFILCEEVNAGRCPASGG